MLHFRMLFEKMPCSAAFKYFDCIWEPALRRCFDEQMDSPCSVAYCIRRSLRSVSMVLRRICSNKYWAKRPLLVTLVVSEGRILSKLLVINLSPYTLLHFCTQSSYSSCSFSKWAIYSGFACHENRYSKSRNVDSIISGPPSLIVSTVMLSAQSCSALASAQKSIPRRNNKYEVNNTNVAMHKWTTEVLP